MHFRVPFLKDFEIARPQIFAGLLLLALLLTSLLSASRTSDPHGEANLLVASLGKILWGAHSNVSNVDRIPPPPHDSILAYRVVRPLLPNTPPDLHSWRRFLFLIRAPFVIFGLWLGGALWWVTRRLYNNAGGYIALALYCSSAYIAWLSSRVNPEIMAAWGLFGIVYTSIGVAHTLYAPPRKWRPRIVLLGAAFGITAAVHLAAALVGLVLAAFFMLYLAPGRRLASLVILAEASIIAFVILWACYGFTSAVFATSVASLRFETVLHSLSSSAAIALSPLLVLLVISVVIFIIWPRTRYFGNWTPLLVFLVLIHLDFEGQDSLAWTLPFAFVFVGGIFADLLETRWRKLVAATVILAIAAQETMTLLMLFRTPH